MKRISLLLPIILFASFGFCQLKTKITVKKNTVTAPSVSLTCTSPGSNALAFNFYRATVSGGPYTIIGTSPMVSACAYTDTSVNLGTTYYYVATSLDIAVGSICPAGTSCESGYSNQATAVIPANPTVTGVSPATGTTLGGTTVTITGTGFASGATVSFGSTAGVSVVIASSTSITVTTPPVNAGIVTVTVTNTNGLSASLASAFTFITPPPNAPTGLTVNTITAGNFELQWNPPVPQSGLTLASFIVYRGEHAGMTAPTKIANLAPTVTSYEDSACTYPNCYYKVEATYSVPIDYSNIVGVSNP